MQNIPPNSLRSKSGKSIMPPSYRKKQQKNKLKIFRYAVALIIVLIACSAGVVAGIMTSSLQVFNNFSNRPLKLTDLSEMFIPLDRKINVLVLGQDYNYTYRGKKILNDNKFGRSDSMMLVGIDPIKKQVSVLSIPRDSRVVIHGYNNYDKINAALAYGGPQLAMDTVTDLTGVPIDYYAVLKLGGLIKLVDLIGGVEMNVESDMYWVDETAHLGINIHKGWHRMNGEQSHQYVRFRKDALGDIGRIQRQQQFVRALIAKLLEPGSLMKLPEMVKIAQEHIITNIDPTEIIKVANFGKTISKEDIKMIMLPGQFAGFSGYWLIDPKSTRDAVLELFPESKFAEETEGSGKITESPLLPQQKCKLTVLNGTEHANLANQAATDLYKLGWKVYSIRKSKTLHKKTQIIAQTGKTDIIPLIRKDLGVDGEVIQASIGDIYSDFTIIVGEDYAKWRELKTKEAAQKSTQVMPSRH